MTNFDNLPPIDTIPWHELDHAYGPATDVPAQINDLRSDDADIRKQALWHLFGNIFHQGSRYPASPYAVPYLAQLLIDPDVNDKHHILTLLVNLALGYDEAYLPHGYPIDRYLDYFETNPPPNIDTWSLAEWQTYQAVRQQLSTFIYSLSDDDPTVRRLAIYALAWFPQNVQQSWSHLHTTLTYDPQPVNQATALLTIAILANSDPQAPLDDLHDYLDHQYPLLQTSAALGLAIHHHYTTQILDLLLHALTHADLLQPQSEQIPFYDGNFTGLITTTLAQAPNEHHHLIIPHICQALHHVTGYDSLAVTRALLDLIIDRQAPPLTETPSSQLTPHQRLALNTIVNHGGWFIGEHIFGNYSSLLRRYGLPNNQADLRAYLLT
ncbi:MAG TPA: hypothetical protein VLL52_23665 [Anaerolineae bacterium]|nr:hypothetical protein [Anaerolineae bacterium]